MTSSEGQGVDEAEVRRSPRSRSTAWAAIDGRDGAPGEAPEALLLEPATIPGCGEAMVKAASVPVPKWTTPEVQASEMAGA